MEHGNLETKYRSQAVHETSSTAQAATECAAALSPHTSRSRLNGISDTLLRGRAAGMAHGIIRHYLMASLPTALVQFARSYMHSVEDLQVFILCVDHRDRWWDATSIARELSITESRARRILEQLARVNLLDIRISDAVRYRFEPGIQELEQQAVAFAVAYHNNPAGVVKLIARSTVSDSVRDFADAFRIKRDDHR